MKNKSFRYLWLGQSLANSGDVFYIVSLMAIIHGITGSAMYMAVIPFVITIAKFFSGLIAPILLDKYRLKSLLIFSQMGKTIFLCFVGVHSFLGFSEATIYLIFGFVFLLSFLDGWATPARNAMLPRLVDSNELVRANSFVSLLDQTTQLGGWAIGGILVAAFGGVNVIWFTFVLFLISTAFMQLINDQYDEKVSVTRPARQSKWESIKEGWILIWRTPSLQAIHVIYTIESMANTVWIAAIIYIYVGEVLHREQAWWGYINASFFLGLIAGGIFGMKYSGFIDKKIRTVIILSSFAICMMTFAFGVNSSPWSALLISALYGFFDQLKAISLQSSLQRSATVQQLPIIFSAQSALISLVFGFSSLAFGFITEILNVRMSFLLAAGLLLISSLYALSSTSTLSGKANSIARR
jgi:MFS transporter, DHA3 family, macrolide efflux protein